MTQYVICADGACSGNPGPGGWAYEIWDGEVVEGNEICGGSGSSPETTNNIMELRAATCAIEDLLDRNTLPGLVKLRLDSEYVLKGIFEWLEGWKAKGWKTASRKPVKNADMWRDLDALITRAQAEGWTFEAAWVKGHEGDIGNERVDTLAQIRRDEAKEDVASGGRSDEPLTDALMTSISPHRSTPLHLQRKVKSPSSRSLCCGVCSTPPMWGEMSPSRRCFTPCARMPASWASDKAAHHRE